MRKFLFFAVAILVFAACDDEKNNDEQAPNDIKTIKSVSFENSARDMENYAINFTYDNNWRLIEYRSSDNSYYAEITYSQDGKQMDVTIFVEDEFYSEKCIYGLNNDGSVKTISGDNITHEFMYTNGYIAKYKYYVTWDLLSESISTDFTWSNGNITAVESVESYNDDITRDFYKESYEYGPLLNNYNMDLNVLSLSFAHISNIWMFYDAVAFHNGGNASKNLIESVITEENGVGIRYAIAYATDNDGFVTKAVFTSDSTLESLIIKFTYY